MLARNRLDESHRRRRVYARHCVDRRLDVAIHRRLVQLSAVFSTDHAFAVDKQTVRHPAYAVGIRNRQVGVHRQDEIEQP